MDHGKVRDGKLILPKRDFRMVDCVCPMCEETPGQYKHYIECLRCERHGHCDDEFTSDKNKEVCDECLENESK